MKTAKRKPLEFPRGQRISDQLKDNTVTTTECMEASALECRIAALEKGLPPPVRDRIWTERIAANSI
ncbi:hypothetical protein [Tardiphaga sp. 768_D3_N2_1]|uniref:hypothetical protein n=1 Tax=Tardiphaga sp. 768_D3_N2_1 TaxID=3240783 RepID=UPI003F8C840E